MLEKDLQEKVAVDMGKFKSGQNSQPSEGIRHDDGKPRYDLLPPDALNDLVQVYTAGVEEYGARNWEKGMAWGRVVGSLLRHTFAWMRGEDLDSKSGLPHMAHAAWNALTLCAYFRRGVGEDDRTPFTAGKATVDAFLKR